MSTLLLLILVAFLALAIWLGYAGYRSTQSKSGPIPPAQTVENVPAAKSHSEESGRLKARPGEADPRAGESADRSAEMRPSDETTEPRPRST